VPLTVAATKFAESAVLPRMEGNFLSLLSEQTCISAAMCLSRSDEWRICFSNTEDGGYIVVLGKKKDESSES
jgi:hypothetical protein